MKCLSRRDLVGGGSSRNFPWSPRAVAIQWGGGSSRNFPWSPTPPVYDECMAILIWVIPNQHLKSTLLGGGEGITKKSTMCTLVKMMTIMDDP